LHDGQNIGKRGAQYASLLRYAGAMANHTKASSSGLLKPGDYVRHPEQPDWGIGQIQSMIGNRITVNFENAGKLLIDGNLIALQAVKLDDLP
jgi:hypothetical protein